MIRPIFRSALYVPTDHARALAKVATLPADVIIFDLEDGVAPDKKAEGRKAIANWFESETNKKHRYILRINHQHTREYRLDMALVAGLPLDGVMLSKVSGQDDIDEATAQLAQVERGDLAIWCNVETPLGIVNIRSIAAHPHVTALVAGTNDLANDLRIRRTADRLGLMHSLQEMVLAARAYDKPVLDGTFVDLEDDNGLQREAEQGRMLGFDGKTLIHPKQIAIANRIFAPSANDITDANAIIASYESAMKNGKAVTLLNGRMIERLHYNRAKETIKISEYCSA
jgi:citrate lyase beta subunit